MVYLEPVQRDEGRSGVLELPGHVVYRRFPAETVVLNLRTGLYHGLNPTAGRMLEALPERDDLDAVAAQLASEYDVPVDVLRADLEALIEQLLERDLAVRREGGAPQRP